MGLPLYTSVASLAEAPDVPASLRLRMMDAPIAPQVATLAASPALSKVRSLEIHAPEGERDDSSWLRPLFGSPGLAALETLVIQFARIDGFEDSLTSCSRLRSLQELHLPYTSMTVASLRRVLTSPHVQWVHELGLEGNHLGDEGLLELSAIAPPELRRLWLGVNGVTADGLAALAQSGLVTRLTLLELNENPIGPQGAKLLARASAFKGLERLEVFEAQIGEVGLRELASSTTLSPTVVESYRKLRESGDGYELI